MATKTNTGTVLTCPECGGTSFVQKEIRKTGVMVIDGKAVINDPYAYPKVVRLICLGCHVQMPPDLVKRFRPVPLFAEHSQN